jgi:hypothetical protein
MYVTKIRTDTKVKKSRQDRPTMTVLNRPHQISAKNPLRGYSIEVNASKACVIQKGDVITLLLIKVLNFELKKAEVIMNRDAIKSIPAFIVPIISVQVRIK